MAGRKKAVTTAETKTEETTETIEVKEQKLETADKRDLEIEELKKELAEMREMLKQAQSAPQVVHFLTRRKRQIRKNHWKDREFLHPEKRTFKRHGCTVPFYARKQMDYHCKRAYR